MKKVTKMHQKQLKNIKNTNKYAHRLGLVQAVRKKV